jgi:predicted kinase
LTAGHSVIVDAVFARPDERRRMEAVAREAGVRFAGIWLDAPADLLKARVAARRGDASDATPAVVERQIATGVGDVDWRRIDADGSPETVLTRARQTLAPGADPGTG